MPFLVCHILSGINCGYLGRLPEHRARHRRPPLHDNDAGDHGKQVPEADKSTHPLPLPSFTVSGFLSASPPEAKHRPVIVLENSCSAIYQTPPPEYGGPAPSWRGHNCLVNPNGEAWRHELLVLNHDQNQFKSLKSKLTQDCPFCQIK